MGMRCSNGKLFMYGVANEGRLGVATKELVEALEGRRKSLSRTLKKRKKKAVKEEVAEETTAAEAALAKHKQDAAVARATACARLCASPTFFRRSLSDLAASASDLTTSEEVFILGAVAAFIAS